MIKLVPKVERMIAYMPLFGTAAVLVIQNFFQDFLKVIGLNAAIAAMALSFILLIWHLEGRIRKFELAFEGLQKEVVNLSQGQAGAREGSEKNFAVQPLSKAFDEASSITPRVDILRVYAASGIQMINFLQHSGIKVKNCKILLHAPKDEKDNYRLQSSLQSWKVAVMEGRIGNLEIRRYESLPTQYEAIFDSAYLISGLFHPNPEQSSGVTVRNSVSVHNGSISGVRIISEHMDRFDRMFEFHKGHRGEYKWKTDDFSDDVSK